MQEQISKYNNSVFLFSSEGQIQWSRYNAMLVVNTVFLAIIGFILSPENEKLPSLLRELSPYAPILGVLICFLWFRMTEKGFIWMKYWINSARKIEESYLNKGINPILNGNELRNAIGGNTTQNASYFIIGIFVFLYIIILFSNFGS